MENQVKERNIKLSKLDIIGMVLIILFLPIIIINATLVIKGMINPEKVPTVFGYAPLIVISDSMDLEYSKDYGNPGAFNKGDLIFIKEINPNDLKEEDIISYFDEDNKIVSHRIIRFEEKDGVRMIITKGDYSVSEDPAVHPDRVIGIYKTRLAKLGGLAMFIQKPVGVLVLIGIPVLIYLAVDLVNKNKEKKASQAKNEELEAEIARLKAEQAKKEEETSSN